MLRGVCGEGGDGPGAGVVMVLVKKKNDDDEYDHNSDDGEKSGDQDFGRGFVVERGYARWWGAGARCGLTCVPPPFHAPNEMGG